MDSTVHGSKDSLFRQLFVHVFLCSSFFYTQELGQTEKNYISLEVEK